MTNEYLLRCPLLLQEVTALQFDNVGGFLMAVGSSAGKVGSLCCLSHVNHAAHWNDHHTCLAILFYIFDHTSTI